MSLVHVRNDLPTAVTLLRHTRLGVISKFEEEGCYTGSVEDIKIAAHRQSKLTALMPKTRLSNDVRR